MKKFLIDFLTGLAVKYLKSSLLEHLDLLDMQEAVAKQYTEFNNLEHESRIESVRDFLDQTLHALDDRYVGMPVCEGGKYNWLILPSGENVLIDFFVPNLALFICIPDIRSASWEEARARGVTRKMWESMQQDLEYIQSELPKLPTLGSTTRPKIIILKWGDSVNHHKLKSLIFSDVGG